MTGPLRFMGVLAHPDDESLGLGRIFARCAVEGVETALVTATRGQSGRFGTHRDGPEHPGAEALGRIREAELRAAAEVLGIRDVTVLDYLDGQLDAANPREAIEAIAHHIRRFRPDVVASFAPDGAYGHPDHVAISQLATAATVLAADPGHARGPAPLPPHAVAKLYYMVNSEAEAKAYQEAFKQLRSKVDGVEREPVIWPEWEITTVIDTREHWHTVWRAVTCHQSQLAGYERLSQLTPENHEALWGRQNLYRAFSTVNGGRRRESDLFEGLRG